jgi:ADP-heptose:LPS heptosyltransferase
MAKRTEQLGKRLFVGLLGKIIAPRKTLAPINPELLNSILIIRNDAIGDMVLTTPFWRNLKKQFPHLTIGVVGSFRNLPIIAHDSDVDYRFECNGMTLREAWKAARAIRKHSWDLVLPMVYNKKTKMALLSKLFAPGAVSSMVLLANDPHERYEKLFSICVRTTVRLRPEDGPMIDLMRKHLEGSVQITIEDDEWRPSLIMDQSIIRSTHEHIRALLENDRSSHYFQINLDAKMEFKEFGLERNLELSRRLLLRFPLYSIFWTASPLAAPSASQFLKINPSPRIHFLDTSSLDELTAIVSSASIVISPDTSVIHIASAEKRPVIGLYPFFHEWPPYKVPNRILTPVFGEAVSTISIDRICDAIDDLVSQSIITA